MARAIEMEHARDPREELQEAVAPYLDNVRTVHGGRVLVAVYERPEKTKGGILLSDLTRKEDEYQGKAGLILKLGTVAFSEDTEHRWGDRVPQVGDWVQFAVGDTKPCKLGDRPCRYVEDVHILATLERPDLVW